MKRKNCWEVLKCGRQPGGEKAEELGTCPAAEPSEYDGTNRGVCSGRFCWTVAGTHCYGKTQGTFAEKFADCIECEFFRLVNEEEGRAFVLSPKDAKKDRGDR